MKRVYWVFALFLIVQKMGLCANLIDVSLKPNAHQTKQVLGFTFNKPIHYQLTQGPKKNQIFLNIPLGQVKMSLKNLSFQSTAVESIEVAPNSDQKILRLVVHLNTPVSVKSKLIHKAPKVLLELELVSLVQPSTKLTPKKLSQTSEESVPIASERRAVPKKSSMRQIRILIDPGHGGKDPGAIGYSKTQEKEVVLKIAKILKQLINSTPGMKAVMTRESDYFVPLRNRLLHARKSDSDLFISLHADAYKNPKLKGSSVYVLSERGATSEAARWLAEKENYSEIGGVDLSDKSQLLRSVLLDLSQTATIGSSLRLGESVLSELKKITPLHIRTVEQAPFVVLKSPDIPSLLIETGFISNRLEEMKLKSPQHQRKIAQAIFQGILNYIQKYPLGDVGPLEVKTKKGNPRRQTPRSASPS